MQAVKSTALFLTLVFLSIGHSAAHAQDTVAGDLILLNDNGAWSWFGNERSVVDKDRGILLVGSTSSRQGAHGRSGDADVASLTLDTGRRTRVALATRPRGNDGNGDDHNNPALLILEDGRYLAGYSEHFYDNKSRFRATTSANADPGDPNSWTPELNVTNGSGVTYENLYQLSAERTGEFGRIYNFTRTVGVDPNFLYSDDNGASWVYGGKLLEQPGALGRPYVNYTSNGVDEIHYINTEDHPREGPRNNSIYHSTIKGGEVFDSFGAKLGDRGTPLSPQSGTRVFAGDTSNVAWTSDIHLDDGGNPYIAFSVRSGASNAATNPDATLHYHYARFDGQQWHENRIAFAGSNLSVHLNYTGNISLDPNNPNRVYISTDVDPATGQPIADGTGRHEIYRGTTADGGTTWSWEAITQNSTVDNLRPVVPDWDEDNTAVVWFRGAYNNYIDYDSAIVGVVEQKDVQRGQIQFIDATPENTTLADGTPLTLGASGNLTTGAAQGAADGKWHLRTGFANGDGAGTGTVLTSNENASETVETLKTTATNDGEAGYFDVFVYYLSNTNEDWQIRAGLSEDDLLFFQKQGGDLAESGEFVDPLPFTFNGTNLGVYQGYLGRVYLESGSDLSIFVDDAVGNQSGASRTWYDGVGLARVSIVPEPSTLNTLGPASALLALFRKRQIKRAFTDE